METLKKEETEEIKRGEWNARREETWLPGKGDSIYTKELWHIDFFNYLFHKLLKAQVPEINTNKYYWDVQQKEVSVDWKSTNGSFLK